MGLIEISTPIVALYADGGVILKNPSSIGGVWAWCAVDAEGNRVIQRGGVVPATEAREITNNHMEQIAITLALEAMPDGWSGTVYSDSMIALGRVFKGWRIKNLPANVAKRSAAAVARLGKIETVLLQGHPTKADLASGIGAKRGFPVSEHNVWCDKECGRQGKAFFAQICRDLKQEGVAS
jgi:ribonuclease HI